MTTSGAPARPRSLADDFRLRDDAALEALLAARPDLMHPVPADVGQLAVRAATAPSVSAALDALNHLELSVCEALAALADPATVDDLHTGLAPAAGYSLALVDTCVATLRRLGLVWGEDLHLVRAARESFGPYPCGLGPSYATARRAVADYAQDPSKVLALLESAPAPAAEVMAQLAWNPAGTMRGATRPVNATTASSPLEWLLARDLIVATSETSVVMPREVALAVRNGALLTDLASAASAVAVRTGDATHVDGGGAQQAAEALRLADTLLDAWAAAPPALLRGGGVAARDLSAAATLLKRDASDAALLVEVAHAARLIAPDAGGDLVPTSLFDAWLAKDDAARWADLAAAWRDMPRAPHAVTDETGDKPNPLTTGVERPTMSTLRRTVIDLIAAEPPGTSTTGVAVNAHLEWQRPRRASAARARAVEAVLREAEFLGVLSGGALTGFGRALFAGGDAAAVLANHTPPPVDHIIVQSDLTALAPGRLPSAQSRLMASVAEVESTGVATTYRFTEASLRRGLDHGWTALEIQEQLSALSRTPLPQPLTYLIADVARTHGSVRVGAASVYLRCDDDQLVAQMMVDRQLAALHLRRLAPGVVVSPAPPDLVLERLRAGGYAPVAESADGTVLLAKPTQRRTSARPPAATAATIVASPRMASAAVRAMRAGDRAAAVAAEGAAPRTSTADTMSVLRAALEQGAAVWIGYADRSGTTTQRVVEPMTLTGGFLTAFDLRTNEVRTFTVARITGVQTADQETA